jgi:hypothetical protein
MQPVMSDSVPPPSTRLVANGPRVIQFGAWVGRAAAAALVCTLPAMIRVSGGLAGSAPPVRAWAALGAAALFPMAIAVVVVRGARQGLQAFSEPDKELRAFGLGLWLAVQFVTLALFGGFLRATTHHHALAGVTFACGALVFAVGWALVCARIVAILRGFSEQGRRLSMRSAGGAVLAVIGYLALRLISAASKDPASAAAAATVVDVLAFAVVAFFASREFRIGQRSLALAGPPAAVFLAAFGITTLRDPPVRQAIADHAPAFVSMADEVSGR